MDKKKLVLVIFAAVLVVALSVGTFAYFRQYILIDGYFYPRYAENLELSGHSLENLRGFSKMTNLKRLDLRGTGATPKQYEHLRQTLPDCVILWEVPFQDTYLDPNTTAITVTTLSDEDIITLDYLPHLALVDALGCTDYAQLQKLQQRRPDCRVEYRIAIGEETLSPRERSLVLRDIDPVAVAQALPHFPELEEVLITGVLPDPQQLQALKESFPQIDLNWEVVLQGRSLDPEAETLDLSDLELRDVSWVTENLAYFPNCQKIDMTRCGLSNEELDTFNRSLDNIQVAWTVKIGELRVRTDVTAFIAIKHSAYALRNWEVYNLRYLTELVALDMGHHNIDNCDFVAYMPHLKYLILADTDVYDLTPLEGLTELIYLELFMTDITDVSPLLKLTNLEDLNLGHTKADIETIAQMNWLKRLWWSGGGIWGPRLQLLKENLPNTELQYITYSSTDGGWREGQHYYEQRDLLGMYYMTG